MKVRNVTDKGKAKRVSVFLHLGLLILALYPLKNHIEEVRPEMAESIEIVFSDGEITSGSASTAPVNTPEPKDNPEPQKEMTKKSAPVLPPSAPVLEEPESPVKVRTNTKVKDMDPTASSEDLPNKKADEVDHSLESTKDKSSTETGTSGTEGEGDHGEKITGKTLGEKDFGGNGIFGRKVIYRAPIAKAAKENGVVSVNVCINREGQVTRAVIYKEGTTVKNQDYVYQARELATQYRFEKDYTAPSLQCGRLTFIFKIK